MTPTFAPTAAIERANGEPLMWPMGHVAGAYLIHDGLDRRRDEPPVEFATLLVLGVGSVLPDLVDKPFAWYLTVLPTGRSLSHSLLFVVPLCVAGTLIARRVDRPALGYALAIGTLSHLLLDAAPTLWREGTNADYLLYPLTSVEGYVGGPPTILGLLRSSMGDPYFLLEFVLLAVAVVVWRARGYPGLASIRGAVPRRS